jgi:hypothetical protein
MAVLLFLTFSASAQDTISLHLDTGKQIFDAACAACHGADGKGAPDTTVGFAKPKTFPDFTQCDQTTPELDKDWKATILQGGHGRGFSLIMPSFSEALTSRQIDMVIEYLRGFCSGNKWPRGELNLPRPLVTEKAYPEDETVLTSSANVSGAPGISNLLTYEKRFGAREQIEITVPFSFLRPSPGTWYGGVGDIQLALKHVLLVNNHTGTILSIFGETTIPTGDKARGLGTGTPVLEGLTAFAQMLPRQSFFQFQAGTEQPIDTKNTPRAVYSRFVLGKTFRQEMDVGRMWTPMVEWLADRDLVSGAKTNWDVLPQMQVTLSRRQHVRVDFGVRVPVTNTQGRPIQAVMYVLWDWFDGGLFEGWK